MVDALLLDPLHPFLIALQRCFDRLEQILQLRLSFLISFGEAFAGPCEEVLVCLFEELVADLAELGHQCIAVGGKILHSLVEMAGLGPEPGEFCIERTDLVPRFITLLHDSVQLHSERFSGGLALLSSTCSEKPADQTA